MTSAEPAPSLAPRRRGLPLRIKLFLPLLLPLALLGGAALFGALQLIGETTQRSLDERLRAGNEVVFREFKKQEELLLAYIDFLSQFQFLAERFEHGEELGILQDRLFSTLEREGIGVTFLSSPPGAAIPFPSLADLFEQARRSGKPRFRYTTQLGDEPMLVVVAPLRERTGAGRFLMLQMAMGTEFLTRISKPLGLAAAVHDLDGKLLSAGSDTSPMTLRADQLIQLAKDAKLFADHEGPQGTVRHLFSLIPLGSSEIVILSLESSASEFVRLRNTLIVQMLAVIGAALLLGAVIYFRTIRVITRPAGELIDAAKALSRGNLSYRIQEISGDELGDVAATFNQMAEQLETMYREKADKETALAVAQQEAQTRTVIERKNREVEKANEELRAHLREISALYQLNQAMVSAPDLNILFDRVLQVIVETLGCDQVVILMHNPGDSVLEVARSLGLEQEALRQVKFRFDQGITGLAAQNLRQIYVKDVEKEPRYLNYHGQVATRGSFVSSPLVVKGRLVGVLNLHKRETAAFSPSELKMVQAIANQTAMAVENAQLLEKARDLSNIDDLTGLANRRHFQEILKREVAQSRRFSSNFSVLMCSIDSFDQYLDRHGRLVGDALLRQVGQALLNNTRGIDLVCRFGNEEFAILLPKTNKAGGLAAAEKLRQCILREPFEGAAGTALGEKPTVSLGISEFPLDSKNIYELMNLADRALYAARKEGGNRAVTWEGPAPPPE